MKAILLALVCLFSSTAYSKSYVIAQTGGYAGVVALGAGYDWKYYSFAILGGYVPSVVGGEDLWSTTLKNQLQFGVLHVGIANHMSHDRDTFWRLPSKYPKKYYPPTGVMTGPYAGIHVKFDDLVFYSEATSLDYYLEMKARNPDYVSWTDIISYALGVYWFI